jgi:hypothetical protein
MDRKVDQGKIGSLTASRAVLAMLIALMLVSGCSGSSRQDDGATAAVADEPASGSSDSSTSSADLSLRASPTTVDEGGSTTLSWSAADADSCSASGGWSGERAASGSETVGPLNAGTTYTLTCSGPGGSTMQMISVEVKGPVTLSWVAPAENVDGSQLDDLAGYRIYYGEQSRSYSDVAEVADAAASSHTLSLVTGEYYLAMTALDQEGNESGYSNEVVRTRD